jgi:hypothetical protein
MPDLFEQHRYEHKNNSVNAVIREFEKEYLEIFEVAKTKWNHSTRDFHGDGTGLKLSRVLGLNGVLRKLPQNQQTFQLTVH